MKLWPLVPVPPAGGTRRLRGIEGLRATAAAAVVIHHVWIFDGGARIGDDAGADVIFLNFALGVTLFFALSGFLLYRPFAAAIARREALPSVSGYLRNRALRILPAYWVILLFASFVLATAATRAGGDGGIAFDAMTDPVELVKAMLLIHDYDPDSIAVGVGPAWSLAVEVVFYLLLPVMVFAVARVARTVRVRERRVALLLAPPLFLLLLGILGKVLAGVVIPGHPAEGYSDNWHSVVERSFLSQADLFSFGMAAAVIHTEVVDLRLRLPRHWRALALAMAAAMFVPAAISLNSGQLSYLPENTAVGLAAALLVAVAAFPVDGARPYWLQRLLELRPVVAAGLVSYSVFLWNVPVVIWLEEEGLFRDGWSGLGFNLALTVAVVGALSIVSYRLVELPALRRKRRREPIEAAQLEAAP